MKTESEENQESKETITARQTKVAPMTKAVSDEDFASELNVPHWSVVSFDGCAAVNLTYPQAVEEINRLKAKKVAGLCIITDEAAARIL